MTKYLNLAIGAPRRLAILKTIVAGHEGATWRKARYCTYVNVRGYTGQLSGGFNDHGKRAIWYCHTGQYFPRERYADECDSVRIDHTGWYADVDGSITYRGLVVALPHGRFIAGYEDNDSGERFYFADLYDDERSAAYAADREAERYAEIEREYDFRWQAANDIRDSITDQLARLRECLALRNNPCFAKLRNEALDLIAAIRDGRETLSNEYSDCEA